MQYSLNVEQSLNFLQKTLLQTQSLLEISQIKNKMKLSISRIIKLKSPVNRNEY